MWFVDILFFIQILSFMVLISSSIGIMYFLYKAHKAGEAIKAKTYELGKDLTNEKVLDYSTFVDNIQIPNRRVYWNTLKAGYKLIYSNESIDKDLKMRLRTVMLSKGILVD